jgi:hypothetical protein
MMHRILLLATAAVLAAQEKPKDDMEALRSKIRGALVKLRESDRKMEGFLFHRHVEKMELAADGAVRTKVLTEFRRDPWEELTVTRVIAKDGQALSAEDARRQEERLRRGIEEKRKRLAAAQGKPREEDEEDKWLKEMPDAMVFRALGTEKRAGVDVEVYEFTPRPGYQAKSARARAFKSVEGKVWLDPREGEFARIEASIVDNITFGLGVFGKLEKGTHFEMDRRKFECGHWFMEKQHIRFAARILMVKAMRQELITRFSNFAPHPRQAAGALGARLESGSQNH